MLHAIHTLIIIRESQRLVGYTPQSLRVQSVLAGVQPTDPSDRLSDVAGEGPLEGFE